MKKKKIDIELMLFVGTSVYLFNHQSAISVGGKLNSTRHIYDAWKGVIAGKVLRYSYSL